MEDFKRKKVAVYIRLGNENQDALARHIRTMTEYVNNHPNWELVSVYSDVTPSSRLSQRVGFAKLLKDAREGKYSVVAIPTPSMLGRKIVDNHKLLFKLEQAGATIDYADGTQVLELKQLMEILEALECE